MAEPEKMVVADPSPLKGERQGRNASTGTPRKQAKGAGFKKFSEQERSLLAVRYPFLSAAQIRSKSAERWAKLSDDDKKEFGQRRYSYCI